MTVMSQNLRLADLITLSNAGYRYVYIASRKKVCLRCCSYQRANFALDRDWLIVADHVNRTSCLLTCDHCGSKITSFPDH